MADGGVFRVSHPSLVGVATTHHLHSLTRRAVADPLPRLSMENSIGAVINTAIAAHRVHLNFALKRPSPSV